MDSTGDTPRFIFPGPDVTPGMREPPPARDSGDDLQRCDFCQSPVSREPRSLQRDGEEYVFCSVACREAMREQEHVFTRYRGYRWLRTGVAALEAKLPQGLLRNSAVLLSAQPGAREAELQAEIVWRTLRRGEPAVLVSFQEPPVATVGRLMDMDWNVLPYLESGDLHILDCFTYRVDDRERMQDRLNSWNAHIWTVAEPEVTAVRDPTTPSEIQSSLDGCLEAKGMVDRGVVVIDSITEFGSLVQPVRAYNLVKDVRAEVCKGRFVPVFAGAAYVGDNDQFPHDLEYMFDGIVDMSLDPNIVEDALIKRLRVRKMSGVLAYPEWTAYEFTSDDGMVTFDPRAEQEGTDDGERSNSADAVESSGAAESSGGSDESAGD